MSKGQESCLVLALFPALFSGGHSWFSVLNDLSDLRFEKNFYLALCILGFPGSNSIFVQLALPVSSGVWAPFHAWLTGFLCSDPVTPHPISDWWL